MNQWIRVPQQKARLEVSDYIRTDVEIGIKEGMLDDFKALIKRMIQNTEEKESDVLVYE